MTAMDRPHYGGNPRVKEMPGGMKAMRADCTAANIPADATPGYEKGCILQVYDGSGGNVLYVNTGSNTSCAFKAIPNASNGLLAGTPLTLNSTGTMLFEIGGTPILGLGTTLGAVPATAASGVNGTSAALVGETGGDTGGVGGSISIKAGSGGLTGAAAAGGYLVLSGGDAGPDSALTGPVQFKTLDYHVQAAPGTLNSTGTLTAALLVGGIVTSTTAAAVAATLDTGSAMDTALGTVMGVDTGFYWSVINTGGNTLTVTASSGHTIVGTATVLTVVSGRFFTRRTAANTWVTYRV